jgi:hypothetical protein
MSTRAKLGALIFGAFFFLLAIPVFLGLQEKSAVLDLGPTAFGRCSTFSTYSL